jgi:hypothetical protein
MTLRSVVAGTEVPVDVLHRLALGIELVDAVTGRAVIGRPTLTREFPSPYSRDGFTTIPRLEAVVSSTPGRFIVRYGRPRLPLNPAAVPDPDLVVTLRVTDPLAYYVARRVRVSLRSLKRVLAAEEPMDGVAALPPIAPERRTLRLTVFPGSNYPMPAGTTVFRGQITSSSGPWAAVTLRRAGGAPMLLGTTFADGNGEFLIVPSSVAGVTALRVEVTPPPPLAAPTRPIEPSDRFLIDPLFGLPAIDVGRLADPPAPADPSPPSAQGTYVYPGVTTATVEFPSRLPLGRTTIRTLTLT